MSRYPGKINGQINLDPNRKSFSIPQSRTIYPIRVLILSFRLFLPLLIRVIFMYTAKGFLKCKQNDADFHKCVTKGANLAIPELVKGKFILSPFNKLFLDEINRR